MFNIRMKCQNWDFESSYEVSRIPEVMEIVDLTWESELEDKYVVLEIQTVLRKVSGKGCTDYKLVPLLILGEYDQVMRGDSRLNGEEY